MTKQLVALIGGLVCAAVFALGILLGVLPLISGGTTALEQTGQAQATNRTYEQQVQSLTEAKERMPQTEASVADLRAQIPTAPLLDQAFAIVDAAATRAEAQITSIGRGELTAFEPRPTPPRAGLVAEQPSAPADAAADAEASDTTDPAAAGGTASMNTPDAATDPSSAGGGAASAPAPAASGRQQVRITIAVTAPTMDAVTTFLDGLRGSGRLLAVDKTTVTDGSGGFDVRVEAITFLQTDGSAR
ncbi:hypothetical protein Q9R19_10410 [Microbacterium sp. ARD32]|uniref:hypothetical protein n=1 Tax=Microbacterium sp. ARD32 TaxID=2962577 RepID=UPI002880F4A8|nr:hypothetical protein [Microbacterium sp. ARD32]MDT0158035.1 hypothetical protein [Microbacterium sp. ARD32]